MYVLNEKVGLVNKKKGEEKKKKKNYRLKTNTRSSWKRKYSRDNRSTSPVP